MKLQPVLQAVCALCFVVWCPNQAQAASEAATFHWNVGVARVDITPEFPIRLGGFAGRRMESAGVRQHLFAKALAISEGDAPPVVIVAIDCMAISDELVQQVARRVQEQVDVPVERFSLTATHSHTAPMLSGVCPTLFTVPIPPDHQAHIDDYTSRLVEQCAQAAVSAVKNRQSARLDWAIGRVGFSKNRRTPGGPVDHDMPCLLVRDHDSTVRAVYVNYACHCVTLSDNLVSGDWAGYAQEHIERLFPGAVALVTPGCGADSNPSSGVTGDKAEIASAQGLQIAEEARRLSQGPLRPVAGPLAVQYQRIDLPFDRLPTRAEWEERAKRTDAVGYHAQVQLAKLDRGESLATRISYPIQSFAFGDSLAMVFLPGEVVVDYALRLKRELDGARLWTNAYSNGVPCYIPSDRVWKEGGYEGGDAMVYFDRPTRFAPGLENPIVNVVKQQLAAGFAPRVDTRRTRGSRPLAPEQSLAALRPRAGTAVDLVVAEPLVTSPVAIDFGPDGRLWVAEMYDYPQGLDGNYQPGGRIRLVEASQGDGRFDKSSVFLEGIPFPTGITVWRRGVLVCAAPDILYAEDSDGDGRADVVKKLYSGFGTHNYQARVNSLEYGLDGWVYGSCGLFGGRITSFNGSVLELGDQDFRIQPDTGAIEPATGRTQQGRPRDDAGNWFGCDNSTLCRHYPLMDHDVRRNPQVAPPPAAFFAGLGEEPFRLYPAREIQLFKLSGPSGRATAACGLGVYRDDLLGPEFRGNVFTCEPVNLVVHRLQLVPQNSSFAGQRGAGEEQSEFLSSEDNWFRPVQARTGPDGGLWIVDMYRYIIEHPRWIPAEEVSKLDVRAGHDRGRIYRVRAADLPVRPWNRLDRLDAAGLVAALDSSSGWQRDMAMQMLVWNRATGAAAGLRSLLTGSQNPWARMQALVTLDLLELCETADVIRGLTDRFPAVRRHAARLAGKFANDPAVQQRLLALVDDDDPQVRLQLACSLAGVPVAQSAAALYRLAKNSPEDPYLLGAIQSSLNHDSAQEILQLVARAAPGERTPESLLRPLLATVVGTGEPKSLSPLLDLLVAPVAERESAWRAEALAGAFEALGRRGLTLDDVAAGQVRERLALRLQQARKGAADAEGSVDLRLAAVRLLGRDHGSREVEIPVLTGLLSPQTPTELQQQALQALLRMNVPAVAETLLSGWRGYGPALRSQVLDILLSRTAWQKTLVDHIEKNELSAGEIDIARRQKLLQNPDADFRRRVEKLLQATVNADRAAVVAQYETAATHPGDRLRGKELFGKTCAPCHVLEGVGHAVGPDLAALANKSPQFLVQEIFDPNRNTDSRYIGYTAVTRTGLNVSGLVAEESATSITLRGAEGKEQVLLRTVIDDLQSTGKSLMPEGLEKDLQPADVADLIAYLTTTAPPAKQVPGNKPAVVGLVEGQIALTADRAAIHGGEITFEGPPFQNIGYWHGLRDHLVWQFELPGAGRFDVWLHYSCHPDSSGNSFAVESGTDSLRGTVIPTGGWDRYESRKVGRLTLPGGTQRLVLRPEGEILRGALMDLQGVYLAPEGDDPVLLVKPAALAAGIAAPEDPQSAAARILDDSVDAAEREALITKFLHEAPALIRAMTSDLEPGTREEYRRIPWIWRVAIAAGKQNETRILQELLELTVPRDEAPLSDWRAVVIGGGLINGISQLDKWPAERLQEVLGDSPELRTRWNRSLELAAEMADSTAVPTGTRYDALRMVALRGWKDCGDQLSRYLVEGTNDELQMGAVSGSVDVDHPAATRALIDGLSCFSAHNRRLAIDGLLRGVGRIDALLSGLESGKIRSDWLSEVQQKRVVEAPDAALRGRAARLFRQSPK